MSLHSSGPPSQLVSPRLSADALLERQYHTMRERALSLAADLDRLQRLGGPAALAHPRIAELLRALQSALMPTSTPTRAEQLQRALSDPRGDPRDDSAAG